MCGSPFCFPTELVRRDFLASFHHCYNGDEGEIFQEVWGIFDGEGEFFSRAGICFIRDDASDGLSGLAKGRLTMREPI